VFSEASAENFFIVPHGEICTPPRHTSILAGITRDSVLTIAKDLGLTAHEREFTRDLLYTADECFLTGTAAEVTPVREVDDRAIGTGTTGPITREIQAAYFRATHGEAARYSGWLTPV